MRGTIDAFLIVEKGKTIDGQRVYGLSQMPVVIGREAPGNNPDIQIQDDYVSRRHVEISCTNNLFTIRDLKSKNGTQLNGEMIDSERVFELKDNASIALAIVGGEPRIFIRFKESNLTRGDVPENVNKSQLNEWIMIDTQRKEVKIDGKLLSLPRKEYELLVFLYFRKGTVCSRDEIIAGVWPEVKDPGGVSNEAIDQSIHRLREKIENDPRKTKRLISKKGFGYMLV